MLQTLYSPAVKAYMLHKFLQAPGEDYVPSVSGTVLTSENPTELYGGLGTVPMLREFTGKRQVNKLRPVTFQITNAIYELTIGVSKDDLIYPKIGLANLNKAINGGQIRYNTHWRKLITDLMLANPLAYDGVAFFSASHTEANSGTQTNLVSVDIGTTTDPTAGEFEKGLLKGVEVLRKLKDDQGEPINEDLDSFVVMVPVPFANAAFAALKAPLIVDAAGTGARTALIQYSGLTFQLVVNPRLTWTTDFALFAADGRGFIRQQVGALEITAKAEGSEFYHDTQGHEYGLRVIRAAGVGDWKSAAKVTFI